MKGLKISGQPIEILETEGQLVVSSRQVAEDFDKEPKHVNEVIRKLIAENSTVKNMIC